MATTIRGHGLNTLVLRLDTILIKFVERKGLSLKGLPMKWMKVEGNALLVVVVGVKVTTLKLAHQGNIILYTLYKHFYYKPYKYYNKHKHYEPTTYFI